mmetsp:Transcript_748/g.1624  ORF Transcript_748/g.1624 Transcript_748/m.1624 type:complete len:185 (-) Transcript_748:177-731(-)
MRYAPAARLSYTRRVAVPALVRDFGEKLGLIALHASTRGAALKLAKAKKGLANEHKRSVGKTVMLRKLGLEQERRQEEEALVKCAPAAAPLLARVASWAAPPPAVWAFGHVHEGRGAVSVNLKAASRISAGPAQVIRRDEQDAGETLCINASNANDGRAACWRSDRPSVLLRLHLVGPEAGASM